jgi:hypothetical protein
MATDLKFQSDRLEYPQLISAVKPIRVRGKIVIAVSVCRGDFQKSNES